MGLSGPKIQGPSAEDLAARKAEEDRLKDEERQSKLAAERERQERIAGLRAQRSGTVGRRSLIKTSELGVRSALG